MNRALHGGQGGPEQTRITHHRVTAEAVIRAKEVHPETLVLVHPECRSEVVDLADFVGSTKQIIDFA